MDPNFKEKVNARQESWRRVVSQAIANGIATPGLKGTIRQDPAETLIYLGVPDINAALKKIEASGGSVVLPRMVIPLSLIHI